MLTKSKAVLPYDPFYTGHLEIKERQHQVREWLRQREEELTGQAKLPWGQFRTEAVALN